MLNNRNFLFLALFLLMPFVLLYSQQGEPLRLGVGGIYYLKAVVRNEIEVKPYELSSLENNLMVFRILEAAIQSAKSKQVISFEE